MPHSSTKRLIQMSTLGVYCTAKLWMISRKDGVVLRYTDHDRPIQLDGSTYEPSAFGVGSSTVQSVEGLDFGNAEVFGAIAAIGDVSDDDLAAGKFDSAEIDETVVDWRYPWAGYHSKRTFVIEDVSRDGEQWKARITSLRGLLAQKTGGVITKECRYDFGDPDTCGFNVASVTQSGRSVSSVLDDRRRFQSDASGVNSYFDHGVIEWTTGQNAGTKSLVKRFSAASGTIELHVRTTKTISASDQFTMSPGCDKTKATCKTKWSNYDNFGGYNDIPGNRKLLVSPDAKSQ